jgi:hypothetical protein
MKAPMVREPRKKSRKAGVATRADAADSLGVLRANKLAQLVQFVEAASRERDDPQTLFPRS